MRLYYLRRQNTAFMSSGRESGVRHKWPWRATRRSAGAGEEAMTRTYRALLGWLQRIGLELCEGLSLDALAHCELKPRF